MPELPEVETVRRQLDEQLRGATITKVEIWRSGRETPSGFAFVKRLTGKTIASIERRAKLLIWRFTDGQALTAHLKMTGRFVFVDEKYKREKHDRILFEFSETPLTPLIRGGHESSLPLTRGTEGVSVSGARLVWSDIRQFGFLHLVTAEELEEILSAYGPEPLLLSVEELAEVLKSSSARPVKTALLDQTLLAGVGNIYADESCHRACIRPTRRLSSLTQQERLLLAESIQTILNESLAQQGTSANDYVDTKGEQGGFLELLRVYGRAGESCMTCSAIIKRIVLGQRGTHYCPKCQM